MKSRPADQSIIQIMVSLFLEDLSHSSVSLQLCFYRLTWLKGKRQSLNECRIWAARLILNVCIYFFYFFTVESRESRDKMQLGCSSFIHSSRVFWLLFVFLQVSYLFLVECCHGNCARSGIFVVVYFFLKRIWSVCFKVAAVDKLNQIIWRKECFVIKKKAGLPLSVIFFCLKKQINFLWQVLILHMVLFLPVDICSSFMPLNFTLTPFLCLRDTCWLDWLDVKASYVLWRKRWHMKTFGRSTSSYQAAVCKEALSINHSNKNWSFWNTDEFD